MSKTKTKQNKTKTNTQTITKTKKKNQTPKRIIKKQTKKQNTLKDRDTRYLLLTGRKAISC